MKRRVLVLVLLAATAACGSKKKQEGKEPPVAPDPVPATGSGSGSGSAAVDSKLVERGEYLSNMLGCGFCHVGVGPTGPDASKPFVGGLEVPEKFGTWRSPNITQDKDTGIGSWTDEQIAAAIRQGVRPDNSQLYPIMPYPNYNRMTDDDAKALVAFLRTVKPVANKVERSKDLALPKVAMPKPTNTPDPVSDQLKHGEYLVTLMHCDNCHTPMGPTGPDRAKAFAGGMEFEIPFMGTGKLYGTNITSDPETGIGKWSQADVEKVIKQMTKPDGSLIVGPMKFYLAGWSKMTDEDLHAISAFIKALPPIKNKVPRSTFKEHQGPPPGAGSGSNAGAGSAGAGSASAGSASAGSASAGAKAGSSAGPASAGSGASAKPAAGAGSAK